MTEFIKIINKDLNMQNESSQTIENNNTESFSTRSQIGQNALIQSKIFKQAIINYGRNLFRYRHRNRTKR